MTKEQKALGWHGVAIFLWIATVFTISGPFAYLFFLLGVLFIVLSVISIFILAFNMGREDERKNNPRPVMRFNL